MSSPPTAPVGRYAMYKEGSNRITKWLCSTASSCRHSLTAKSTSRGHVSTSELLKYAEFIVSWKPPIVIPGTITELLEDVIIGREVCADWFAYQQYEECKGHEHMIDVLRQILMVLKEARRKNKNDKMKMKQSDGSPRKDSKPDAKQDEALANLFEILQVEDVNEDVWNAAPAKNALKSSEPSPTPMLEVDERDEQVFALYCFCKDMADIRQVVKETWQEYCDGKISAVTATAVTNTAYDIMSNADDDFAKSNPSLDTYNKILEFLNLSLDLDDQGIPVLRQLGTNALTPNAHAKTLTDILCPEAAQLVYGYLKLALKADQQANERMHMSSEARWQWYPDGSVPVELSFCSYGKLLFRLFPDLFKACTMACDAEVHMQPFLAGLFELCRTGKVRVAFVGAMQISKDIHEIVIDPEEPFGEMVAHAAKLKSRADKYHLFRARPQGSSIDPEIFDEYSKDVDDFIRRSVRDIMYRSSSNRDTLVASAAWTPTDIWKSMPQCAASRTEHYLFIMHEMGTFVANDGAIILALAYLYKACRHAGLLSQPWEDMDWFLVNVGREHPFVQEVSPQGNMLSFARHFYLALGGSATMFARDSRGSIPPVSRRSQKEMWGRRRQFDSPSDFVRNTAEVVREIFTLGVSRGWYVQTALQRMMSKRMLAARSRNGSGRRAADVQIEFTGLQMLEAFKTERVADGPGLSFDFLSFFVECAEQLDVMRSRLGTRLLLRNPGAESWDHFIASVILKDACETESAGQPVEKSMLGDAATVLNEHIARSGGKYSREATEVATGAIPDTWTKYMEDQAMAAVKEMEDILLGTARSDAEAQMIRQHLNRMDGRGKGSPGAVRASPDSQAVAEDMLYHASVEDAEDEAEQIQSDGPDGWPVNCKFF